MSSIVLADVPTGDFALRETFETAPDAVVECEQAVEHGADVVLPFLWVDAEDAETFEAALENDPTVESATRLATCDPEVLYLMEWAADVALVVEMLTAASGTILDASGTSETWRFRILYPDREHLGRTGEFCESHGLSLDVREIHELDVGSEGRYDLTDEQAESLLVALEAGYFDVPRETDIAEVAEEVGISHQALSERLRRAQGELVETMIWSAEGRTDEYEL